MICGLVLMLINVMIAVNAFCGRFEILIASWFEWLPFLSETLNLMQW
jgi:hypothetical protein